MTDMAALAACPGLSRASSTCIELTMNLTTMNPNPTQFRELNMVLRELTERAAEILGGNFGFAEYAKDRARR